MRRSARLTTLAAFLVAFACPTTSMAQSAATEPAVDGISSVVAVLSANVLLGGLTSAVRALISGGDIEEAFARGAVGGGLGFAGKQIAVSGYSMAPLSGRVVTALGNALVTSASDSSYSAQPVRMAFGPLRVHWSIREPTKFRLAVSVYDAAILLQTLSGPGVHLDWNRTLAAATPVFVSRSRQIRLRGDMVAGVTTGHIVLLDNSRTSIEDTYRHELIHVMQLDFLESAWDRPLEQSLRTRVPGLRRVPKWIEFNVIVPVMFDVEWAVWKDEAVLRRLLQSEAEWFERR